MFYHWQQINQYSLCSHSYCTLFMLRSVHMPTQHMCIEQNRKCFSFGQRDNNSSLLKLPLLLMHETAEVQQKMKKMIKNKNNED